MRTIVLAMTLALAACGGSEETPKAGASSEAPAKHKGLACKGFPDFVALPQDASVSTCKNGDPAAARMAGMIVFETDMAPKDAIAFFRDQAHKSGLPDGLSSSNPDSPMYSANDTATKRSIQVTTERQAAGGTQVTLNWSKENWDAPEDATGAKRNSGGD